MTTPRITEITVKGMRSLADVRLRLDGLTVLIGDNGSGKSSLIEACELLRRVANPSFVEDLNRIHGGVRSLLRFGASQLELGIRFVETCMYEYSFALGENGTILAERLDYWNEWAVDGEDPKDFPPQWALRRTPHEILDDNSFTYRVDDLDTETFRRQLNGNRLALSSFGEHAPFWAMRDVLQALRAIDVHLPFDVSARWVQQSRGQLAPLRGVATIEPADALSRFGVNLPNAWNALKNDFSEAHWRETMDYVRMGLGRDIESINLRADPGGGSIALRLKIAGIDEQLPAFALSDGMLAYLSFVALFRLNTKKSLIAFDEPELHLHPELLIRVLGFFEEMARERPVLLATHSDRLLDGLTDPARSVVLCELDERRATKLVRPDPDALRDWLTDYRGLGDVRGAGHAASILTRREDG
jgi:predicted ATPase